MRGALLHPIRFGRDHRFTRTHASAYLDGELGAADAVRVRDHAHGCPSCARFVMGLQRTVTALGRLRADDRPARDVAERTVERLRDEPSP